MDNIEITTVDRPKFYGQYLYSISIELNLGDWHKYFELKEELANLIGQDGIVSGSKILLIYYAFTNSDYIINQIYHWCAFNNIILQSVRKINNEYKDVQLRKKRFSRKGNWYGAYPYRIRLKRAYFDFSDIKEKLSGKVLVSGHNPALVYFTKLNDVVLFKLLYPEYILDVQDAATIRG